MKPKNEDAEVIEVDVGGEKKKIVMAPGRVTMVFQTVYLIRVGCSVVPDPDPGFTITLNRCIFLISSFFFFFCKREINFSKLLIKYCSHYRRVSLLLTIVDLLSETQLIDTRFTI